MALSSKSLILYGFQVTELNRSLDFKASSLGPVKQATLRLGYYSLTDLCVEIGRAMFEADQVNVYVATPNRAVGGGLENRVTISTSGTYLKLLFGTGPRIASSVASLIGFLNTDYTGLTSYIGSTSAGIPLLPELVGYNYLGPEMNVKVFGSVNVSASGLKEAIVYQIQNFIDVEFKYEHRDVVQTNWGPFINWAIQQRAFEFTPNTSDPLTVYNVTLDKTNADGKGLAWKWKEQLPQFPNLYTTGALTFRVIPS